MNIKPIARAYRNRNGNIMPRFGIRLTNEYEPSSITTSLLCNPGYRLVTLEIGARHIGGIVVGFIAWLPNVPVVDDPVVEDAHTTS
ncbi:hypothetical protein JTZ10_21645 [Gordonia rubripertincta]|uniref:Uncharacterized protein n=1 Tax=Gordonia rubripertincta TaxID=36822 RepID=A0AAW4G9B2_GORRU|nr:hypothetical protein [Gordonia rubripertincta]MBM7280352.1 hypothetical protein [Gordonia rubripertincta]